MSGLPSNCGELDNAEAVKTKSSLAFGEVLPIGVDLALDASHLDARAASVFYDLGSGNGKFAIQAFLQFPNLTRVVGVELTFSRGIQGMCALSRLAKHAPERSTLPTVSLS